MSETKNDPRPISGEDPSPGPDEVVTDGPSGLRRFEKAMRRIFRAGRPDREEDRKRDPTG